MATKSPWFVFVLIVGWFWLIFGAWIGCGPTIEQKIAATVTNSFEAQTASILKQVQWGQIMTSLRGRIGPSFSMVAEGYIKQTAGVEVRVNGGEVEINTQASGTGGGSDESFVDLIDRWHSLPEERRAKLTQQLVDWLTRQREEPIGDTPEAREAFSAELTEIINALKDNTNLTPRVLEMIRSNPGASPAPSTGPVPSPGSAGPVLPQVQITDTDANENKAFGVLVGSADLVVIDGAQPAIGSVVGVLLESRRLTDAGTVIWSARMPNVE